MSRYGQRYACGLVRENGRTLIVTAGLGTSGLPLRLGAVPDLWLIRIGPAGRSGSRAERPAAPAVVRANPALEVVMLRLVGLVVLVVIVLGCLMLFGLLDAIF